MWYRRNMQNKCRMMHRCRAHIPSVCIRSSFIQFQLWNKRYLSLKYFACQQFGFKCTITMYLFNSSCVAIHSFILPFIAMVILSLMRCCRQRLAYFRRNVVRLLSVYLSETSLRINLTVLWTMGKRENEN